MPFEWFMAQRFLREGRAQSLLILAGASVGVGVIVFLSALISGLQTSLIDQTLSSQAHVVVRPQEAVARALGAPEDAAVSARIDKAPQRTPAIDRWQQTLEVIRAVPGVIAAAPTVAGSAFAGRGTVSQAVSLRGVDSASYQQIVDIENRLQAGAFRLEGDSAVIGVELARDLGLSVGDKVRLTGTGERREVFTIAGVFDLGNKDVNQRWVFVPLRSAQTLLDLVGTISTIEIRVDGIFTADSIAERIAASTGLIADPWTKLNRQLLIALKSQNSSSYMIQFFVVIAVALGIASVLVVSVVQKSREIGILKAVGTPTWLVRRIFLIQGGLVGLIGSAAGSALGAGLALFFSRMAVNPDGSPTFPVDLNLGLFLGASVIATATGVFAALAPASRAAKLDPAQVVRHG
jgi:lipoprotein-releasing system permease protein